MYSILRISGGVVMTIWIVEEGSYEESQIVGVYSSEELARFHHPQLNAESKWGSWIEVSSYEVASS